ncbi:DUF1003 domain-containing protein [Sphingorhabdus sp.]|jgi:uncharacterized membrane protein|uniref:DUF1003 domain-containing protein n=1 Tax=Sphingorhabdus sp. TaxID=1902408 RepID=UPI0037CBA79A
MTNGISVDELAVQLLGKTADSLSRAERRVLESIHHREITSRNLDVPHGEDSTFGQRLADHVAAVGGSWGFIIGFAVVLFGWMLINSRLFESLDIGFDPYPFIFLNLMLSMLAAIQAPIIMMSQNRQGQKDRQAAAHDYEVNLRAELEIIRLHEKINLLQRDVARLVNAGTAEVSGK